MSPSEPSASVVRTPATGDTAQASQERLLGIIASATDAIITVDRDQRITLFNAAAERMFGCPASEAVGTPLDRFIPHRFRDAHRGHIEEFARTGVTARTMGHQRALAALRADGEEFPVEATISQATVGGQKLFTAIVRDVTERRRSEEALRESEGRLRAIVDTAVDGIITIDERGRIASFNPAASRLFGYAPEEVMGRNVNLLMPEPYRAAHDDYLRNYLSTGDRKIIGIGREVVGLRKDGTEFPMDLAVSETVLGERRIFTGIVRDMSERKRAEEALTRQARDLARQAEDLARSNVELERFAYVASHDLQEPMRTVRSFGQLLQRRCAEQLTGDAREYLRFITDGVQRMQSLINDLLRFSRETTTSEDFSLVSLNDVLQEVMMDMEIDIEKTSAQVVVGKLPEIWAIPSQMRQLFQNLVSNAIKFRKPGTVPVVQVYQDGQLKDRAQIVIQDNGIGFDPKYAEEIFMVFKRLHSYHEFEGSGVGLSICKKIIERHNGHIRAEAKPGSGARFLVDLPIVDSKISSPELKPAKISFG